MNESVQKAKEFALEQIAPYYADPTTCGFNRDESTYCQYLTTNGKMCVAGKNMIDPSQHIGSIDTILNNNTQDEIFKPEVVGILTDLQWVNLQPIHDAIALRYSVEKLKGRIDSLGLFTYEELVERANQLKETK